MTKYSSRAEGSFGSSLEFSLDSELFRLGQRALKLDQKVTQLFELLRDPVFRYLIVVTGNPAEAEEIAQEAFLRLYRRLHSGQPVGSARAWVFREAHNLAIDRKRAAKYCAPMDALSWAELCQIRQDGSPNPEERVLEQEKFEKLHTALARLSPQERQCMDLRAEGFRYREIAEILAISPSSVAEFLRRALKKLLRDTNG